MDRVASYFFFKVPAFWLCNSFFIYLLLFARLARLNWPIIFVSRKLFDYAVGYLFVLFENRLIFFQFIFVEDSRRMSLSIPRISADNAGFLMLGTLHVCWYRILQVRFSTLLLSIHLLSVLIAIIFGIVLICIFLICLMLREF